MNQNDSIKIADGVVTELQRAIQIPSGEGIRMFCVGKISKELIRQQAIMLELIEDRICQDRKLCGCCCNVWEAIDEIREGEEENGRTQSCKGF